MAIPVLGGKISCNRQVQLVHGNHALPAFETMEYEKLDKLTCLVRQPKGASAAAPAKEQEGVTLVADKSKSQVLVPGASMTPSVSATGTKRKHSNHGKVEELPMLERSDFVLLP